MVSTFATSALPDGDLCDFEDPLSLNAAVFDNLLITDFRTKLPTQPTAAAAITPLATAAAADNRAQEMDALDFLLDTMQSSQPPPPPSPALRQSTDPALSTSDRPLKCAVQQPLPLLAQISELAGTDDVSRLITDVLCVLAQPRRITNDCQGMVRRALQCVAEYEAKNPRHAVLLINTQATNVEEFFLAQNAACVALCGPIAVSHQGSFRRLTTMDEACEHLVPYYVYTRWFAAGFNVDFTANVFAQENCAQLVRLKMYVPLNAPEFLIVAGEV